MPTSDTSDNAEIIGIQCLTRTFRFMRTSCLKSYECNYVDFASDPQKLYMYSCQPCWGCKYTNKHKPRKHTNMINIYLLGLIFLGWMPLVSGLPNVHLARATTAAPVVSFQSSMAHSAYMGVPTVTGALNASSTLAANISSLGVARSATTYPSDGKLHDPAPAPYVPAGGVGTNGTTPMYNAKSDFDFESLVSVFNLYLFSTVKTNYGRHSFFTLNSLSLTCSMLVWPSLQSQTFWMQGCQQKIAI